MDKQLHQATDHDAWVPYSPDAGYAGAEKIVQAERRYIECKRQKAGQPLPHDSNLTGIALSGGGIRSATFCLGVMQALARHGKLEKLDYLSTVSGGGYIGSSLSWLLHRDWTVRTSDKETPEKRLCFNVTRDCFPFGTHLRRQTAGTSNEQTDCCKTDGSPEHTAEEAGTTKTAIETVKLGGGDQARGAMLRYLRQHGNYLTPGNGITFFSLLAVILRGMLLSLLVYFPLIMLGFLLLNRLGLLEVTTALGWAAGLAVAFTMVSIFYSLGTYFSKGGSQETADEDGTGKWYEYRKQYERYAPWLLYGVIFFLVVAAIPWINDLLAKWHIKNISLSTLTGALTAGTGFLASAGAFFKSGSQKGGRLPVSLLAGIGALLLLFGILLLAYRGTLAIESHSNHLLLFAALSLSLLLGFVVNLNYVSVHRYYRDRLMESYMPDAGKVVAGAEGPAQSSPLADRSRLHGMCPPERANGPYHLINSNVILIESGINKFRGRGGDNFILSPMYCGSNATGWRRTDQFMQGTMNLSTAMAISGAAANPNAGPSGEGPTRTPLLAMLMSLLNLQLGYWAPNPNPKREPGLPIPNFFLPGIWALLQRHKFNEKSSFLQLSDGGHFENLGLYELIRRKLKLIIGCDAGADAAFNFGALANAVEKVRADFGVKLIFEEESLRRLVPKQPTCEQNYNPEEMAYAEKGHALAEIIYPDGQHGKLIFLKTTFIEGLSADLLGYKKGHPKFPDQTTGDQFFDEKQFEAYREIGYSLCCRMLEEHGDLIEVTS